MKGRKKGWKAVLTAVLGVTFVCVAPIAFFSGCFLVVLPGDVGCGTVLVGVALLTVCIGTFVPVYLEARKKPVDSIRKL